MDEFKIDKPIVTNLTIQQDLAGVLRDLAQQQQELTANLSEQRQNLIRVETSLLQIVRDKDYLLEIVRDGSHREASLVFRLKEVEEKILENASERKNFWKMVGAVFLSLLVAAIGAWAVIYAALLGK